MIFLLTACFLFSNAGPPHLLKLTRDYDKDDGLANIERTSYSSPVAAVTTPLWRLFLLFGGCKSHSLNHRSTEFNGDCSAIRIFVVLSFLVLLLLMMMMLFPLSSVVHFYLEGWKASTARQEVQRYQTKTVLDVYVCSAGGHILVNSVLLDLVHLNMNH